MSLHDKHIEHVCVDYAYGKVQSRHGLVIVASEAPDYLIQRRDRTILGVEVTEVYPNASAARIVKIKGYSTELLAKKPYRHKEDRKFLLLKRARMSGEDGGKEKEFDVLLQHLPPFKERVALLTATIASKEQKFEKYRRRAPAIDLIVYDVTGLFAFSEFNTFFPALAHVIGKAAVV